MLSCNLKLFICNFKPLQEKQDIVLARDLVLGRVLIEAIEVELKDSVIRQPPRWYVHYKLEAVDSFISKAALVSHLAAVKALLCNN